MPQIQSNQIKGRVAELELIIALERQGYPAGEIVRDFGLDLSVQVPERPLTALEVKRLYDFKKQLQFEVSAGFIHIQVKSNEDRDIGVKHLNQWADAIERGETIVLAFVIGKDVELYSPTAISTARNCATLGGYQKTFRMTQIESNGVVQLPLQPKVPRAYNHLGVALRAFDLAPEIKLDVKSLLDLDPNNWSAFVNFVMKNVDMIADLVFYQYPKGRCFNDAFDGGIVCCKCSDIVGELWRAYNVESTGAEDDLESLAERVSWVLEDSRQTENSIAEAKSGDYFGPPVPASINVKYEMLLAILRSMG